MVIALDASGSLVAGPRYSLILTPEITYPSVSTVLSVDFLKPPWESKVSRLYPGNPWESKVSGGWFQKPLRSGFSIRGTPAVNMQQIFK